MKASLGFVGIILVCTERENNKDVIFGNYFIDNCVFIALIYYYQCSYNRNKLMTQYNNSVENITKILTLFTNSHPRWGVSEIAREMGFSKTTAFNLLSTLEKTGFLVNNEEIRKYELGGTRIANLASTMSANLELNQKGASIAQGLSSAYGFQCNLGIWGNGIMIVIFSCGPSHMLQIPSFQVGPRIPAYCSALGRAFLAFMEKDEVNKYLDQVNFIKYTPKTKIKRSEIIKELNETKARGFSISNEEMSLSNVSFGAPIFNRKKIVAGAISIFGPAAQILSTKMNNLPGSLCLKALQISQSLGYGSN